MSEGSPVVNFACIDNVPDGRIGTFNLYKTSEANVCISKDCGFITEYNGR